MSVTPPKLRETPRNRADRCQDCAAVAARCELGRALRSRQFMKRTDSGGHPVKRPLPATELHPCLPLFEAHLMLPVAL
jgi:hypothetical protein